MNKEFIPYEQALALKELGFDEPCFGSYVKLTETQNTFFMNDVVDEIDRETSLHESLITKAPLYQQAFRWFREKYKLHQYIKQYYGENFFFHIEDMVHPRRFDEYTVEMLRTFNESSTQEEAELACLKKLIEIVKSKTL